eukprot:515215-Prorocentrum_minimum.AAC.1
MAHPYHSPTTPIVHPSRAHRAPILQLHYTQRAPIPKPQYTHRAPIAHPYYSFTTPNAHPYLNPSTPIYLERCRNLVSKRIYVRIVLASPYIPAERLLLVGRARIFPSRGSRWSGARVYSRREALIGRAR